MESRCDTTRDVQMAALNDADVKIIVDSEEIPAHRHMLSSSSSYFKAMFNSNMKESISDVVDMKDVPAVIMKVLIESSYSGSVTLTEHNALDVLVYSSMFQFEEALDQVTAYLVQRISKRNCLEMLSLANSHGVNQLYNKTKAYILWYMESVIENCDFEDLSIELLLDILCCDLMRVDTEQTVLNAGMKWVCHCEHSRLHHLSSILRAVRWNLLSLEELQQAKEHRLLKDSPEACSIINNRGQSNPRGVPQVLGIVGGMWLYSDSKAVNKHIQVFDEQTCTFHNVTQIPYHRDNSQGAIGFQACMVGEMLYVTGGASGLRRTQWYTDVWRYNSLAEQWAVATQLTQPRRHHSVCVHNSLIYLVGGFDRFRVVMDTVEVFDTITGRWSSVHSLPKPVYTAAACVCGNKLYVVKHDIQCCHLETESWTILQCPLPFEIGIHQAACVGAHMYLIGQHINKLTRFDTETKTCEELGRFKEASGAACIVQNRIYVVGGDECEAVEAYNIDSKQFIQVASLMTGLRGHSVVNLPYFPKFR